MDPISIRSQIPHGVQDRFLGEAVRRRRAEAILRQQFARWGYQEVIPPTFEYADNLEVGAGPDLRQAMYRFFDREGRTLALRADFTPQIARIAATKLFDRPLPLRCFYIGSLFRYEEPQAGRKREFTQAGVELIGADTPAADAEVVALAVAALEALGLRDFQINLGQMAFFHALTAGLDAAALAPIRRAIDHKNQARLDEALDRAAVTGPRRALLRRLPDLVGGPEVLDQARTLAAALPSPPSSAHPFPSAASSVAPSAAPSVSPSTTPSAIPSPSSAHPFPSAVSSVAPSAAPSVSPPTTPSAIPPPSSAHPFPSAVSSAAPSVYPPPSAAPSAPLDRLAQVYRLLQAYGVAGRVTLDLGEVRGMDYYTGITFRGIAPGLGWPVLSGGRYDDLIAHFGRPLAAVGFGLGLERALLLQARRGAEPPSAAPHLLVRACDHADCLALVGRLRRRGVRVALDLFAADGEALANQARQRGIARTLRCTEGGWLLADAGGERLLTASALLEEVDTWTL